MLIFSCVQSYFASDTVLYSIASYVVALVSEADTLRTYRHNKLRENEIKVTSGLFQ